MTRARPRLSTAYLVSAGLLLAPTIGSAGAAEAVKADPGSGDPVARGAYVFQAAGCLGCHTDEKGKGAPLVGGRALPTPFGTYYSPNITPDPETGIGGWTVEDLTRALREGVAKDGDSLFPVFPFPSYTRMRDRDIADLHAYLMAQPPVRHPNREHEVSAPYGWRITMPFWSALFLSEGPKPDTPGKSAEWNRGRYLVNALGHCGECHTPRGSLGALEPGRHLAGNPQGPEGDSVPGLTPLSKGFAKWSVADIDTFLDIGMMPDGDFAGGSMAEVIRNSTSKLTKADRHAIAIYLKDLPVRP